MSAWGGIASGIGSAASGAIGGLFSMNQASKQRKANKRLAEYSYQKDLEQWNRENEYNDPSQQMQRLKDAGLNPNLMYGNGASTSVGNTSTSSAKYQRPEVPRGQMQIELPNVLAMLNQYQDIQNKGLQGDILRTNNELLQKDLGIKDITEFWTHEKAKLTMSQRSDLDNTIGLKIAKLKNEVDQGKAQSNIINKDWKRYRDHNLPQNTPWHAKFIEGLFTKYIQKHLK